MRILVTGNAGFVGTYLARALLTEGHSVSGLDKVAVHSSAQRLDCHTGNILDRGAAMKAMSGAELVVNLAAEHQDWGISRETYFEVNRVGTRVLLDVAADLGIRRFVLFSSVAVYGTSLVPSTETTELEPDSDYGASKRAAEHEVQQWVERDSSRCALIVRPTVIYGPRMNDFSNIYRMVDQIARRRFLCIGAMTNIKSLAYIENVIDGTRFLCAQLKPGVHTFNITDEQQLSARAIARHISKSLGVWMPPFSLPYRPVLAGARALDVVAKHTGINIPITAARITKVNTPTHHRSDKLRLAGFRPRYSIYEGLDKACEWYKQRQHWNQRGRCD